ncbi:MAG: hypothetical protein LBP83_06795 [Dysgonamonadaceae bacterium]|jgi:hypothetical protein|nr:hypothetical protein [Dysgonamonadaceae bacterium]
MKNLEKLSLDVKSQIEEARLNASELMSVEGGLDVDADDDWCLFQQCQSGAEKICYTGV